MDFGEIRRLVLVAIASDDKLCDLLVLKGGNALDLIYQLGNRTSLDVDFSMEGDVANIDDLERMLTRAITDRFDAAGYVVFDTKMALKPRPRFGTVPDWWGGYNFDFKIIPREEFKKLDGDKEKMRRQATAVDSRMHRIFEVQISRHEYCGDSDRVLFEGYELRVYSKAMIVCEKLRAICQQLPEYPMVGSAAGRARDFYDIAILIDQGPVDMEDVANQTLLQVVFEAKKVPLPLLLSIETAREFHRLDWPRVVDSVRGQIDDFDVWFDRVLAVIQLLEAAGVV